MTGVPIEQAASFVEHAAPEEAQRIPRGLRALAGRLVRLGCSLAIVCGVGALLIPMLWSVDPSSDSVPRALVGFGVLLIEVFAFHGGLALLAIGLAALLCRRRWLAVMLVAIGAVHAGPGLAGATAPAPAFAAAHDDEPTLTVLSQNLLFSRADLDTLAAIVEREQPDAIMLQEVVGERVHEIIEHFGDAYPHTVWPNTHRWGGMLLSRRPFTEVPDPLPGQDAWRIDQPIGVIEFDGAPVTLMSVHLPAPNSVRQLVAGPQMSGRLAGWIRERDGSSTVLAGDFNAPLWTTRMSQLRAAGLERAHDASGAGRGATWPARTPLRFAPGIRLDQAAFTGDLRCIESAVLEPTGSDHRPVLARFVRASSASPE